MCLRLVLIKRKSSLQSQMQAQNKKQEKGIAEIHGTAIVNLESVAATD